MLNKITYNDFDTTDVRKMSRGKISSPIIMLNVRASGEGFEI